MSRPETPPPPSPPRHEIANEPNPATATMETPNASSPSYNSSNPFPQQPPPPRPGPAPPHNTPRHVSKQTGPQNKMDKLDFCTSPESPWRNLINSFDSEIRARKKIS